MTFTAPTITLLPLVKTLVTPPTTSRGILKSSLGGTGGPITLTAPTMTLFPFVSTPAMPLTTSTGTLGASGLGDSDPMSPANGAGRSPLGFRMVSRFVAGRPGSGRALVDGSVGSDVKAAGDTELLSTGRRAKVAACAAFDSIPNAAKTSNIFFMVPLPEKLTNYDRTNVNLRIDHIMHTWKRSMEFLSVGQQKMPI